MSIRCGDSRKGVGIAMDNESSRLLRKECAEILEAMKVCYFVLIDI
jgi:WD repeat-containing protein 19